MKIKHLHLSTTDSTSLYIKENFKNVDNFAFVSTDFQFEGKGRDERKWFSPIGENLLFSFAIKDQELVNRFKDLSIACAYIISKYLEETFELKPSIKWPNDVYVDGKKICGILLEGHNNDEGEMDGLIIGIGLNVNQILFNQGEYIHPATSLKDIKHKDFDVDAIAKQLFVKIVRNLLYIKNGNDDFIHYAMEHNYLLDKEVYVEINKEERKVKVICLNYDGTLRVEYNHEYYDLLSGEVHFSKIEL